jgi:hypothetical protein
MDADPPKRKRRWFQFSLRTLLVVVTLVAVACAWPIHIVKHRKALLERIHAMHGSVFTLSDVASRGGVTVQGVKSLDSPADPPLDGRTPITGPRKWLGDAAISLIRLPTAPTADEEAEIKGAFPEAAIAVAASATQR